MPRRNGQKILGGSLDALLFYAGLEISHNIFGDNCSSPQTTELRIGGAEGGGAAESTLMKWVHIASSKALILTGAVGLFTGNWFSFLGALVGTVDMQVSFWYAKKCGRRLRGGDSSAGVSVNGSDAGTPTVGGRPLVRRP